MLSALAATAAKDGEARWARQPPTWGYTSQQSEGTSSRVTTTTTNDSYQVTGTRTATGSGTVTVSGLFDAASGGNLFVKGDFAGIALVSGDSIAYTFKVVFA